LLVDAVTTAWFGKVLNTNYNLELHTTADFDAAIVTDVR